MIEHPTLGSEGKKTFKQYLKSEHMDRQTNRRTDRRTFWLIESIGPEGRYFKKENKKYERKIFIFLILQKKIGQSGGASRWRVCYQRGLHRLVFINKSLIIHDPNCSQKYTIILYKIAVQFTKCAPCYILLKDYGSKICLVLFPT